MIQLIECRSLPTWHVYIRMPRLVKTKCRKRSLQLPWVAKKDDAGDYSVTGTPVCICVVRGLPPGTTISLGLAIIAGDCIVMDTLVCIDFQLGNVLHLAMFFAAGDYSVMDTLDNISVGMLSTGMLA